MNDGDLKRAAVAWLAYNKPKTTFEQREALAKLTDTEADLAWSNPETHWLLIQLMCSSVKPASLQSLLATDLLEDLLEKHGTEFIDRVEVTASSDPRFAKVLCKTWKSTMPDEVWQRVQRAF
ncbi:DUF6869 domain-containing protein [Telmatobacter bradus]|uniref:DUF6869 domain-containing protein n=1 Tax=Telmatobacter bradus TaxID=474953 RepID=UPI003B430C96